MADDVMVAHFFSEKSIKDNDIKNIARKIRQKNKQEHFLVSFIQNKGYILWNDAEKVKNKESLLAYITFCI